MGGGGGADMKLAAAEAMKMYEGDLKGGHARVLLANLSVADVIGSTSIVGAHTHWVYARLLHAAQVSGLVGEWVGWSVGELGGWVGEWVGVF